MLSKKDTGPAEQENQASEMLAPKLEGRSRTQKWGDKVHKWPQKSSKT